MAKRLITSAIGLVIFFGVLFLGETALTIAVVLATFGMLVELYTSLKSHKKLIIVGFISSAIILAGMIFDSISKELTMLIVMAIYLALMVNLHSEVSFKDVCTNGFLTIFVTTFFGTIIRISDDFGIYAVLLVFVCAWMTDSGAYFTGRAIGKTKLIPNVSPKKTVEGAIGGIITALISSWIYITIIKSIPNLRTDSTLNYFSITIIALVSSIMSQLGDLVASSIKRDCNIKDFGNLLPGHGGIFDRFDSVIYIAPFVYYVMLALC